MGFLLDKLESSAIGNTIAHAVYRKMIRKGKLANELKASSPRLRDDAVSLYLVAGALKWLFGSGPGLRRVFWAVVIGAVLGWLIGAPSLPLVGANIFGMSMWYTAAASHRLGIIIGKVEQAAQDNFKRDLND